MQNPIQFRTASGEQVAFGRECMLEVFFPTFIEYDDHEKSKLVRYEVRAVIGPVEQNLLRGCKPLQEDSRQAGMVVPIASRPLKVSVAPGNRAVRSHEHP